MYKFGSQTPRPFFLSLPPLGNSFFATPLFSRAGLPRVGFYPTINEDERAFKVRVVCLERYLSLSRFLSFFPEAPSSPEIITHPRAKTTSSFPAFLDEP